MIDVLFVALFAAAAGEPQTAPPPAAPAVETSAGVAQDPAAAPAPEAAPAAPATEAAPAEAAAPAAAATTQTAANTPRGERRRCRREPVTGSNIMRRVCRTVNEEDTQREDAATALERGRRMTIRPGEN